MTIHSSKIVTLADAARTFAGDGLTRTQLKVFRARLRRHKITAKIGTIINPKTGAEHYAVIAGTSVHIAIGERI